MTKDEFIALVRLASKAPSGHNTQPWKFRLTNNTIIITPDFNAALPVVDHYHRELFISLGCAVENLCIAATSFHYAAHIIRQDEQGIVIELTKKEATKESNLLHQIEKRQTNRSVYKGKRVPDSVLDKLKSIDLEKQIHLYVTEVGSKFAQQLRVFIIKGNQLQMENKACKKELMSWMRFNDNQIAKTESGLSYKVFGNPALPEIVAKPIVSLFLNPEKQNQSDKVKLDSSSHLILFTTQGNTLDEWIDLGRCLQRFLLTASKEEIACAYMNQPCEVEILAKEMQEFLPINGEFPSLILRIGYADTLPYSPRKKISQIIE